jgi:hypothetical protein
LTPEQKQSALQRHHDIILATIDYLLAAHGGCIVIDQEDIVTDYYEQQKLQIAKYYNQRRLDRLQRRLATLIKGFQTSADLNYTGYIKERTGYDIDIFADLQKRVDAIIAHNEIRSKKEFNDAGTLFHFYHKTVREPGKLDVLRKLLLDYGEQTAAAPSRKGRGGYSEVISKIEKDGVEETVIEFSSGRKPKHLEEEESVSPDGHRKLRVTKQSNRKHSSTQVEIFFPAASSVVYSTNGIRDVKAYWKNNNSIVIETKKEYMANTQNREIRSFDDVITIEYIESLL